MNLPEIPPGFVIRTELAKAAWENGFRLDRGTEAGWIRFASTTASGITALAGSSMHGPWLLTLDNPAVIAEIDGADPTLPGPGLARWCFPELDELYGPK